MREAASKARSESQKRVWSAELIDMIRQPNADANERVLQAYAASRALINVGDDSDIETLSTMLNERDIAPNVYFWLKETRKQLEEQWKKTTSKWPEPWLPWQGAIERVEGALLSDNNSFEGNFTLWRRDGVGNEFSDWGGSATLKSSSAGARLMFSDRPQVILQIPGRSSAQAIITRTGDSATIFSGSGPYPRAVFTLLHTVPVLVC